MAAQKPQDAYISSRIVASLANNECKYNVQTDIGPN